MIFLGGGSILFDKMLFAPYVLYLYYRLSELVLIKMFKVGLYKVLLAWGAKSPPLTRFTSYFVWHPASVLHTTVTKLTKDYCMVCL